jgi:hypothetical protein
VKNLIAGIDRKTIEETRKNVMKCQGFFNWETEEAKLLELYENLFLPGHV